MAGRGTDVLLGGNAKGLTQQALELFLLPVLCGPGTGAAPASPPPAAPLEALSPVFHSLANLRAGLPPPVRVAFDKAWSALRALRSKEGAKKGVDPAVASAWLSEALALAEVDRSRFLLERLRAPGPGTLEELGAWLDARVRVEDPSRRRQGAGDAGVALAPSAALALRRYALLQWAWFEERCREYGRVVRAAGGLRVIVAAAIPTRNEAQLRGRAGR